MVTKAKTKPTAIPALTNPLLEKVRIRFEEYVDTCGAINDDYLLDKDVVQELGWADENFRKDLAEMDEEHIPITREQVEGFILGDVCTSDDIKVILDAIDEVDTDYITDRAAGENGIILNISSIAQREKLRTFLETEIWPDYNEQKENINF